jgi:adenylate cyclase
VTILFTDVADSTALTERLGDANARGLFRVHERVVREALAAHGGTEITALGDGFLLAFGSAARALACAAAIQRAIRCHRDPALRVRIGVNAGEPLAEDGDLYGSAVNLAARIAAAAPPDGILVADVVRQLAAGKNLPFARHGEVALRGFDEPVVLWALRWADAPAT